MSYHLRWVKIFVRNVFNCLFNWSMLVSSVCRSFVGATNHLHLISLLKVINHECFHFKYNFLEWKRNSWNYIYEHRFTRHSLTLFSLRMYESRSPCLMNGRTTSGSPSTSTATPMRHRTLMWLNSFMSKASSRNWRASTATSPRDSSATNWIRFRTSKFIFNSALGLITGFRVNKCVR